MAGEEERRQAAQGSGLTERQQYWLGLYQQYHQEIRRYFARYVKRPYDVDDLMQTVFLNLIAHHGDLANPAAYLWAVARHQLSYYWRCRKRSMLAEQILSGWAENDPAGGAYYDWDSDPLRQMGRREMQTTVDSLIEDLSPALGEALRLRYLEGLRLSAAAARAGCSRIALKKRLERAKMLLNGSFVVTLLACRHSDI